MGGRRHLRADPRSARRPGEVRAPRRPAFRERRRPRRHGAQQGAQGHHRQIPDPPREGRAVRARLGLPRPAHRIQGRAGVPRRRQDRHRHRDPAHRLRRLRPEVHRPPARPVQTPRRLRRLGEPLPHARPPLRGRRAPHVRRHRGEGLRLPRQEARVLEHPLQDRARRGRGRVRRPREPERLRALPPQGRAEHLRAHLDDHAVDAPREPRGRLQPRLPLLAGDGRGRRLHRRQRAALHRLGEARLGQLPDHPHAPRRRAGHRRVRAPVLRPHRTPLPRRVRHQRHRHRLRPYRARPRRGRLPARPAREAGDLLPGRRRRPPRADQRPAARAAAARIARRQVHALQEPPLRGQRRRAGAAHREAGARPPRGLHPQLSPLLALQDAHHLPRGGPVVHPDRP